MRENASAGPMRGAGYNPILAWAKFKPVAGSNPTLTHGLGISVVRTAAGVWKATIDGAIKPQAFVALVSAISAAPATVTVTAVDEKLGTINLLGDDALAGDIVLLVIGAGP